MLMVESSPSRARKARAPPFLCGSRFSLLGTLHDSRVACLRFSPSGAYCFAIYLVRWSQTKEDAMFTMSVKRRLVVSALAVAALLILPFSSPPHAAQTTGKGKVKGFYHLGGKDPEGAKYALALINKHN